MAKDSNVWQTILLVVLILLVLGIVFWLLTQYGVIDFSSLSTIGSPETAVGSGGGL